MGNYQTFRGNPEQKLFYLLGNFVGGINTEFSDDNSNDVDFDSIINFDMDKLGTLNKRGGFGELNAISEIFNTLPTSSLPNIKNRTADTPNPETANDNVVYMKLLRNDNKCFRALSGFSGEKAYRKYQEMYGFQNNQFILLVITTKLNSNGEPTSSTAWYYKCTLPPLETVNGHITNTETMTINCYKTNLSVQFNWDRNLMNMETIEYYDKIYFTNNNKCLVTFDRSATINSNTSLGNAFKLSGYDVAAQNTAHVPSGLEIRHIGFNLLCNDPLHAIDTQGIGSNIDSIQGMFVCTTDNKPLLSLPLGKKCLINIIYTGSDNGFDFEFKEGDKDLTVTTTVNSSLSTSNLKVYNVTFKDVPSGEVEIKITKTGADGLEPYYDYYNVEQVDAEAKPVEFLNIGDYGICEMYNRAVYYKDDTIWFSEINDFTYIPNYNYVTLPIEPTDKITKICYFKKSYIIFTKQKIYKMTGAFGTSDFAVSPVNTSLGCHAGNTVIPIEDTLYFTSPRGLYALRSSQFVEGFENVRELDLKVKKLTSDFTKYSEALEQPAIRFNGISERAYAVRYRDKYLLFYNNYNDKGDYAAVNDLDVLAYQFDINAYTTYRFVEKPTFLFTIDGAIETFATVAEEKLYEEVNPVVEYDFTQADGTIVEDLSGNDRDAVVKGGYEISSHKGVELNGTNSKLTTKVRDINLLDGLRIKLDTKDLTNLEDSYPSPVMFKLKNNVYSFPKFTREGGTATSRHYVTREGVYVEDFTFTAKMDMTFTQLSGTSVKVDISTLLGVSDSAINKGELTYELQFNGVSQIASQTINVTFRMEDEYTYKLDFPSFVIQTDEYTGYEGEYSLLLEYRPDYVSQWGEVQFGLDTGHTYTRDLTLTNLAYGGTSLNLPYYTLNGIIDERTGHLAITVTYEETYETPIHRIDELYTLESSLPIDFRNNDRKLIEIVLKPEGEYLKCSYYIDNEKVEDIGYIPISLINELPSKAENIINIGSADYYTSEVIKEDLFANCNLYYCELELSSKTSNYNLTEGTGNVAIDTNRYYNLDLVNCTWLTSSSGVEFDGVNTYLQIPSLPITVDFTKGFIIEFEGNFSNNIKAKIFDSAIFYGNDDREDKNASINCFVDNGKIGVQTTSLSYRTFYLTYNNIDITQNHKYKFECVYNLDKTYTLSLYIDNNLNPDKQVHFVGGISNMLRASNLLGKSNTEKDNLLKGVLKNFAISTFINTDPDTYRTAVYEFDTTPTDFGKDIYVELITKGLSMKYPQHMKKLKHIFVKAIGGNNYGEFFFELYADGHRVNDPRQFFAYLDENGTIVYDYTGTKILTLDEVKSLLGNIRLGSTKLGEGKYQTKKLVIPQKAKNFSCKLYGDTGDYVSIESLGFVCKLGKVKEG